MIKIYDNIVPPQIQIFLDHWIHNTVKFKNFKGFPLYYNSHLTSKNQSYDPGFTNMFLCDWYNSLGKDSASLLTPLYYLSYNLKFIITKILQGRVFLQTPRGNIDPQPPHVDRKDPHFVCLYYVNDSDGNTIFYNNNKEIIKSISPKKGRIVLFDGSILHSGSHPKNTTRTVININFNKIDI